VSSAAASSSNSVPNAVSKLMLVSLSEVKLPSSSSTSSSSTTVKLKDEASSSSKPLASKLSSRGSGFSSMIWIVSSVWLASSSVLLVKLSSVNLLPPVTHLGLIQRFTSRLPPCASTCAFDCTDTMRIRDAGIWSKVATLLTTASPSNSRIPTDIVNDNCTTCIARRKR